MSGRYLTDLANVCRGAGLAVVEYQGWTTRARSSGGYSSGRPTHVMCHHDASSPNSSPESLASYECYGADAAPICNLHLMRDSSVWILAAGATNTNGSGHDSWGGGVPDDSMNTHAIGIEAANNGVGEPWSGAMQDAYVVLVSALCSAYGIPTNNVRDHFEWAPSRKIDRFGPSRWSPNGQQWNADAFRGDVASGGSIPLPGGADNMLYIFIVTDAATNYAQYVTNGMTYRHLPNKESVDALSLFMAKAGLDAGVQQVTKAQIGWAGVYIADDGRVGSNPYL